MAAAGYTPLSLYYSTTASTAPTAGNLVNGELAINITDGKLYYKDNAGVVQVIAGKGGAGVAGGSNTQVQYNSSGSLAGSANMTFNGTTLTLANDASISGLTVGKGGGAITSNTSVGSSALAVNTTGTENTAIGRISLAQNTTGAGNTGVGYGTLYSNIDGALNTAVGDGSLQANSSGNNNAGYGFNALRNNTTGSQNTASGMQALYSNTTASNNTAVGYQALYNNSTASNQTAIGYQAGKAKTSGDNYGSVFVGYNAGYQVSTGTDNTLIGASAGQAITTAYNNTAVGGGALYSTTANSNTAFGYNAGFSATTGLNNTFIGGGAGSSITTGGYNTILGVYNGNQGGLDIRTASNYIVLADGAGNPRGIFDNSGNFLVGTTSNAQGSKVKIDGGSTYTLETYRSGTSAATQILFTNSNGIVGQVQTSGSSTSYITSSDYRLKDDVIPMQNALATVAQLKPVTYKWKADGSDGQGFIAHELQAVVPDCVSGTKDEVDAEGNPIHQGIDTSFLVATLTAAIQELKAEFDAYKATHP
jgi:hypothetical protein